MSKNKVTISSWWYDLWRYTWGFRHLRDYKYKLKSFILRYDLIRTGLSKTRWHDKPELVLYGNMELLVDFVEKEKCFEIIDFDASPDWKEVKKEIEEIYDWWKDYPNRQKEIEISLTNWHDSKFFEMEDDNLLNRLNSPDSLQSKRYFNIHNHAEEQLTKEEVEMLVRLMKIKDYLWT